MILRGLAFIEVVILTILPDSSALIEYQNLNLSIESFARLVER